MPETDIGSAVSSDLTNAVSDYSVAPVDTDGVQDSKETRWNNAEWTKQLGYYKKVHDLKKALDALGTWTIGKGFLADDDTRFRLMRMRGYGKDTFNTLLKGLDKISNLAGDSFAEIVRDSEGEPVNLKPLNPGAVTIVANRKGLIVRYELLSSVTKSKRVFQPGEIFHLVSNRVADEIHGTSIVPAVEDIILAREEAMADMRVLMHRHVKPIIKWQLDTDDTTKIAAFKATADAVVENGENIFIPMGAVEADVLSVPANSTLNPLPWIDKLDRTFWECIGVPKIVVGGSNEMTEATAKICYMAFEQTVEERQLYLEEQVALQLGMTINLEFPASLQNEMLTSQGKSETMQASTPEDTAVKP